MLAVVEPTIAELLQDIRAPKHDHLVGPALWIVQQSITPYLIGNCSLQTARSALIKSLVDHSERTFEKAVQAAAVTLGPIVVKKDAP